MITESASTIAVQNEKLKKVKVTEDMERMEQAGKEKFASSM